MATINLGAIKFNWQGAYAGGTAYVVDDVVSYNGSSYICKLASTGNLPTNNTYWDQMSSAGTNGTDLTSTLTTQGDLVYRDASGLQRLGAGTSGQVLQTGGAGANPSWTTMSSDVVKLASGAITSTTGELRFNTIFTSDYRAYRFIFSDFNPSTMNGRLDFNYVISGTDQTGNYYYQGNLLYGNGATGNFSSGVNQNMTNGKIGLWGTSSTALYASHTDLTISNPNSTRTSKQLVFQQSNPYETDQYEAFQDGACQWRSSSAVNGIVFFANNGNIGYLEYIVLGYKH